MLLPLLFAFTVYTANVYGQPTQPFQNCPGDVLYPLYISDAVDPCTYWLCIGAKAYAYPCGDKTNNGVQQFWSGTADPCIAPNMNCKAVLQLQKRQKLVKPLGTQFQGSKKIRSSDGRMSRARHQFTKSGLYAKLKEHFGGKLPSIEQLENAPDLPSLLSAIRNEFLDGLPPIDDSSRGLPNGGQQYYGPPPLRPSNIGPSNAEPSQLGPYSRPPNLGPSNVGPLQIGPVYLPPPNLGPPNQGQPPFGQPNGALPNSVPPNARQLQLGFPNEGFPNAQNIPLPNRPNSGGPIPKILEAAAAGLIQPIPMIPSPNTGPRGIPQNVQVPPQQVSPQQGGPRLQQEIPRLQQRGPRLPDGGPRLPFERSRLPQGGSRLPEGGPRPPLERPRLPQGRSRLPEGGPRLPLQETRLPQEPGFPPSFRRSPPPEEHLIRPGPGGVPSREPFRLTENKISDEYSSVPDSKQNQDYRAGGASQNYPDYGPEYGQDYGPDYPGQNYQDYKDNYQDTEEQAQQGEVEDKEINEEASTVEPSVAEDVEYEDEGEQFPGMTREEMDRFIEEQEQMGNSHLVNILMGKTTPIPGGINDALTKEQQMLRDSYSMALSNPDKLREQQLVTPEPGSDAAMEKALENLSQLSNGNDPIYKDLRRTGPAPARKLPAPQHNFADNTEPAEPGQPAPASGRAKPQGIDFNARELPTAASHSGVPSSHDNSAPAAAAASPSSVPYISPASAPVGVRYFSPVQAPAGAPGDAVNNSPEGKQSPARLASQDQRPQNEAATEPAVPSPAYAGSPLGYSATQPPVKFNMADNTERKANTYQPGKYVYSREAVAKASNQVTEPPSLRSNAPEPRTQQVTQPIPISTTSSPMTEPPNILGYIGQPDIHKYFAANAGIPSFVQVFNGDFFSGAVLPTTTAVPVTTLSTTPALTTTQTPAPTTVRQVVPTTTTQAPVSPLFPAPQGSFKSVTYPGPTVIPSKWLAYPGYSISGATIGESARSGDVCLQRCMARGESECTAVDYDSLNGACWFHNTHTACGEVKAASHIYHVKRTKCPAPHMKAVMTAP